MSTQSPRLGLIKPERPDLFSTADIAANWAKVDQYPGVYVCTSSTRPSWSTAQAGMCIREADTQLEWLWTGTAWARTAPSGRLRTSTGAYAYAMRTSAFSTASSASYVVALALLNVVVPDGARPLRLEANWTSASASGGYYFGAIVRAATVGGGPTIGGDVRRVNDGEGGPHVAEEPAGLAAGSYSYSYQVRAVAGGTVSLSTLTLSATEL